MKHSGKQFNLVALTAAIIVLAAWSLVPARPILQDGRFGPGTGGPQRLPSPLTVDQVVHNLGNVATTVDNWGYIGGYSYYGLPSGEFPRGSGHDYLAEIRYWMGGVNAAGDTLVANSYQDFQAMAPLATGVEQGNILLSTDTTRYYNNNYDPSDTVGMGDGNPAFGWRVWDPTLGEWTYANNYNPLTTEFFDGGPISVQESHYRFTDNALGSPLMGLEMTHTVLQWNYCYNEDFMFVIVEITNTSNENYTDFAFGLYSDIDVGGPDGSGENGRLGDLVASDTSENLAWTYEQDGWDEGWNSKTGFFGTKYLETPDDIGMTAFRTGAWALVPDNDPGRYALINSAQTDNSLPPTDQYYIQCTRGIDLTAGKTIRVVYALVAGVDSADFQANASLAQNLYDNYFVGPEPPATPTLTSYAGDEEIYLVWNDSAQSSLDPLTGLVDFAGYKLYRSDNRGKTWADSLLHTDNTCMPYDPEPVVRYTVTDPADPIQHSYVDTGLVNGVEYWYCLVAIDGGDTLTGVDSLQSGFGVPESAVNVVTATPRTDPAGLEYLTGTITHQYNGSDQASEGSVSAEVFDRNQLLGADYKVVFEDRPEATYWHLINVTTGDTVLADQTTTNADPGMFEVSEGLRIVVTDAPLTVRSMGQTAIGGAQATLEVPEGYWYGSVIDYFYGAAYGNQHYRSTYEFRYTGNNTEAPAFNDNVGMGMAWSVPFECWNTTTNERVALAVYDFGLDGTWDPWDMVIVVNYPYDAVVDPFTTPAWPQHFSWFFGFDETVYNPAVGDVYTIEGPLMNSPEDVFMFSADGVGDAQARASLADIRVVPDPYYVYATQWEVSPGEAELQFQHLPENCTIRIYTLAGDLVRTLVHDNNTGTEVWNLQTERQRQVASGIYFYHVESEFGNHLGRFAVIK